jgi:hypothetical protein
VVPCIFKYSIKQPTRCTINLKFIALSRRHRSTCFGHCCSHHQEPPPTAFAASGYRMVAGWDVLQAVVGKPTTAISNLIRTTNSYLKIIISTNCYIHTVVLPDEEPRYARNMYMLTKYTKNKLCIKLVFFNTIILRCAVNRTYKMN